MDTWYDHAISFLADIMAQNVWFAPILSLAAGVVTSFTPCSLSAVPLALAYMERTSSMATRTAFRLSLTMAAGMAGTFAVFGSAASIIGHYMHGIGHWWSLLMGMLMILMALQTWGVIKIFPREREHRHSCRNGDSYGGCSCQAGDMRKIPGNGYGGAFLTGALSGVFASHCAGPVMVALLAMVAQSENGLLWGIFLMILYAAGHSILLVLAGTGYSAADRWIRSPKYNKAGRLLRVMLGAVILFIGLWMLL